MNIKKILVIITLVFICTACTIETNLNKSAKNISNTIVKSLQYEDVDTSKLTEYEQEIVNEYIDSHTEENYIVNLDEVHTYPINDSYQSDSSNDSFVYLEDGKHLIKYSDITWIKDNYATILIDGERKVLYKHNAGLFREETVGDLNYTYSYDFSNDYGDRIEFYYKSIATTDGLVIRMYKENKKITNIYVIPETEMEYNHERLESDGTKRFRFFSVSFIAFAIVIVSIYGLVKLIKR